jgi:hypothetical protein
MKRIYTYKNHEVTVEPEPAWKSSHNFTPLSLQGYVALVQIVRTGSVVPATARLRLTSLRHQPFPTESEALMAGFSAGQRIVDDAFNIDQ